MDHRPSVTTRDKRGFGLVFFVAALCVGVPLGCCVMIQDPLPLMTCCMMHLHTKRPACYLLAYLPWSTYCKLQDKWALKMFNEKINNLDNIQLLSKEASISMYNRFSINNLIEKMNQDFINLR